MRDERPTLRLSPREEQLLNFAAEGLTDAAIAHKLGISEATVGTYWGRVRIKMGPYSRTELVALKMRAESEATIEKLTLENEQLIEKLKNEHASAGTPSYRDLLANAPDAMLVVTSEGLVEYANLAALELFGYEEAELVGNSIQILVPDRFRAQHSDHRKTYLEQPDRRQMGQHLDTPALHKTGKEFLIRAALSAVTEGDSTSAICAIRPAEKA